MRLGVICPSEIAFRRFMPALQLVDGLEFKGLGIYLRDERFRNEILAENVIQDKLKKEYQKAKAFIDLYGGKIFEGYRTIVESSEIDAIYIPLPPALHYQWAKKALECGKHVLVEKPFTISLEETRELVEMAETRGLALHENYMFNFHQQLNAIEKIIKNGEIGDVRLYRISFGFPQREATDFRYNRSLGGGALIDAGGYTIKYASRLLGETAKIKYAQMNYTDRFEVDIYGSAAIVNEKGITAQIAFGMDNEYKCELEVWGSKGCLRTGRVLTAPAGFFPEIIIRKNNRNEKRQLPEDNAFKKSIERFLQCIQNNKIRRVNYKEILKQAEMVDEFGRVAGKQ